MRTASSLDPEPGRSYVPGDPGEFSLLARMIVSASDARCGGKPAFPKGPADLDAEGLEAISAGGVGSRRVRSWRG